MRREETTGTLRDLADHLFCYTASLTATGEEPELQSWKHCYKSQADGRRPLYIEIVGPKGRLRKNAIFLNSPWDDRLGELSDRVKKGKNIKGGAASAELWVFVGKEADIPLAEEFIWAVVQG